jgi:hypothetical protein
VILDYVPMLNYILFFSIPTSTGLIKGSTAILGAGYALVSFKDLWLNLLLMNLVMCQLWPCYRHCSFYVFTLWLSFGLTAVQAIFFAHVILRITFFCEKHQAMFSFKKYKINSGLISLEVYKILAI